jgi:thiol-disulfide isomerase/thioredoxin
MWFNILIAVCVGVLTYGLTIYLDNSNPPKNAQIIQAPVSVVKIKQGEIAPNFSFTDLNEASHNLQDFSGKIVILNFWASWCPPCVKEFPDLLQVAEAYPDEVVLLALSSDHDLKKMNRFLTRLKRNQGRDFATNVFIAIDENQEITREIYKTFKLPETYIIDSKQKLRHKLVGADWTVDELHAIVSSL